MFKDLWTLTGKTLKQFFTSRLLPVVIIFTLMFGGLIYQLFDLQIIHGNEYLDDYVQLTEGVTTIPSTRGNIYDRNGKLLAYNQLAYSVTYTDTGVYTDGYAKNEMLLKLIPLLEKNGENVSTYLSLGFDSSGQIQYTTQSESARLRFLRDVYGKTSVNALYEEDSMGVIMAEATAEHLFEWLKDRYGVGTYKNGETYEIDDQTALKVLHLRYGIAQKACQKYKSTTLASKVSRQTMAEVLENSSVIRDVQIEEESIRVYNDPYIFSHILGWTGVASSAELEELKKEDPTYQLNDIVGKSGIEQSMELYLSGTKGSKKMYLDSVGKIIEIAEVIEPIAGNDVYLSIDRDLQMGIYSLIEQHLAGILSEKIKIGAVINPIDSNSIEIEFTTAVFQLINNNILSYQEFDDENASVYEKEIHFQFVARQREVIEQIKTELTTDNPTPFLGLSEEMKGYSENIYEMLKAYGVLDTAKIDLKSETYLNWLEETISLQEFLRYAVVDNWLIISKLPIDAEYASTEDTYRALVSLITQNLSSYDSFNKLVYKNLIEQGVIRPAQLCLALFDQNVLDYDKEAYEKLANGTLTAYHFFIEKVESLELTPAMLALDPCSASCVLTDVNTGEVLALVTYPGYDINRLSGSIDAEYYQKLTEDLSYPFLNRATQVETAPGSIFKVLSSIIGLDTEVITDKELINDTGIYENLGVNLRCWNWFGHGDLDVVQAITWSCNYFFCEVGYRLSTLSGNYDAQAGLDIITQYAKMFGLGTKSGVEIAESAPYITTTNPIPSCIGQGSHNYANIHLSRYLTTLANSGTLFEYSLINQIRDVSGDILLSYHPTVQSQVELRDDSIWQKVQQGMRNVITDNTGALFVGASVNVAGKTGTAEEQEGRANHATFIGYAPYENPEIGITVAIPHGYGSGNASSLGADVFKFYYGDITLEEILAAAAKDATNVVIPD